MLSKGIFSRIIKPTVASRSVAVDRMLIYNQGK